MRHLVPVDHADQEMGNPGKPAWNYKLLLRVLVRRRVFLLLSHVYLRSLNLEDVGRGWEEWASLNGVFREPSTIHLNKYEVRLQGCSRYFSTQREAPGRMY